MKSIIYLSFLLLLLSHCFSATALDNGNFQQASYDQSTGLPVELLKGITQDSLGFIWLASDNGLYRYDGNRYEQIGVPGEESNLFKSVVYSPVFGLIACSDEEIYTVPIGDNVSKLKKYFTQEMCPIKYPKQVFFDGDSLMWITGYNELLKCYSDGSFQLFLFENEVLSNYSRSFQLIRFSNGSLYVISEKGNLYHYDSLQDQYVLESSQLFNHCLASHKLDGNRVLIGSNDGVELLVLKDGHISKKLLSSEILPSCFVEIDSLNVLVGSWSSGVYSLTQGAGEPVKISPFHVGKNRNIKDIFIDRNGMIWIVADNGMQLFYDSFFNKITMLHEVDVQHLFADKKHKKLFFTSPHSLYSLQSDAKDNMSIVFDAGEDVIISTCLSEQYVWVVLSSGEIWSLNREKSDEKKLRYKIYNRPQKIVCDNEDRLWLLVENREAVNLFALTNERWEEVVFEVDGHNSIDALFDVLGNVMVSKNGAVYQWNTLTNAFEIVMVIPKSDVADDEINQIISSSNGNYFLATKNGLISTKDSVHYVKYINNFHEEVKSMVLSEERVLWFTNCNGVNKISSEGLDVFNDKDGLVNKITNIGTLLFDQHNVLWVGTISGLAYSDKTEELHHTSTPRILNLEGSGAVVDAFEKQRFPSNFFLMFDLFVPIFPTHYNEYFCALYHKSTGALVQRFPNRSRIEIKDLKEGSYRLVLQAKHKGNFAKSNPLVYTFEVYTIWYNRIATWLIILLLISSLVIIFFIVRNKRVKLENRRLEELVAKRTLELKQKNFELHRINKSKDRLFSILAHDLRSPFSVLITLSEYMLAEWEEISEKELYEQMLAIKNTSDTTFILLENLLQWSQFEKGTLKVQMKDFNLKDNIDFVIQMTHENASLKSITLICDMQSAYVHADVPMTDTILRNLVSNAIKFTPIGGEIQIKTRHIEDDLVQVSIIDNGVGMEKEKVDALFDVATNSSTFGTEKEKGSGLGLILVSDFISLLGGKIWVESKKGEGTAFHFTLQEAKE